MKEFSPRDYLKIDIANNFGLDKENWDTRINWFNQHEEVLDKLIRHAEKPALFYAGVMAWRDINNGIASGYPISLDACASGAQIMSCLVSDSKAAKLCGVIDTGKREDLYTNVYNHMNKLLNQDGKITRANVKRAIMTSLYGSEKVPTDVFGEGEQLQAFYESMETLTPDVWELNKFFLDIWDSTATKQSWVMPDNFHVHIKIMRTMEETVHFMDELYKVPVKVNAPKKVGRSIGANLAHSIDGMIVRELTRRCSYDEKTVDNVWTSLVLVGRDKAIPCLELSPDKDTRMVLTLWDNYLKSGYLSARILDHLNDSNVMYVNQQDVADLIDSLPKKPFEVLSIHDCFRVLPSYGNDIRKQYALQLSLIAKSDLLSYLVSQLLGKPVQIGKADPDMYKQILNSDYALS